MIIDTEREKICGCRKIEARTKVTLLHIHFTHKLNNTIPFGTLYEDFMLCNLYKTMKLQASFSFMYTHTTPLRWWFGPLVYATDLSWAFSIQFMPLVLLLINFICFYFFLLKAEKKLFDIRCDTVHVARQIACSSKEIQMRPMTTRLWTVKLLFICMAAKKSHTKRTWKHK